MGTSSWIEECLKCHPGLSCLANVSPKVDRGAPRFQQRASIFPVRARRDEVSYYVVISANLSHLRTRHTNLEPA